MTDKLTPAQRHRCMSHIRAKNTKPEMLVRKFLFARGYRYRIHHKGLPGTPDIVLRKYRTVIFINGCFWHGHEGCSLYVVPKSHTEFWQAKINRNKERDQQHRIQLRDMGWHVIEIWECQLKPKKREATLESLDYTLNKIFLNNRQVQKKTVHLYNIEEERPAIAAEEDIYTSSESSH